MSLKIFFFIKIFPSLDYFYFNYISHNKALHHQSHPSYKTILRGGDFCAAKLDNVREFNHFCTSIIINFYHVRHVHRNNQRDRD